MRDWFIGVTGSRIAPGQRSVSRWLSGRARDARALGRSDDDLHEVWVEPAFADEIDGASFAHLERTLFVLPAGDGDNRRVGCLRRISRVASTPSITGSTMSISTTSGEARPRARRPRARRSPPRDLARPPASSSSVSAAANPSSSSTRSTRRGCALARCRVLARGIEPNVARRTPPRERYPRVDEQRAAIGLRLIPCRREALARRRG